MSTEAYLMTTEFKDDGRIVKTIEAESTFNFYFDEPLAKEICEIGGVWLAERIDMVEIEVEEAEDIVNNFDFSKIDPETEKKFKQTVEDYKKAGEDYIAWYCY
jgi:hypothetical protein